MVRDKRVGSIHSTFTPPVVRFFGPDDRWRGIGEKFGSPPGRQGDVRPQGLKARVYPALIRRHKCLLHPVILGGIPFSPWRQMSPSGIPELNVNLCEIYVDIRIIFMYKSKHVR
jgi:hypothetical protein